MGSHTIQLACRQRLFSISIKYYEALQRRNWRITSDSYTELPSEISSSKWAVSMLDPLFEVGSGNQNRTVWAVKRVHQIRQQLNMPVWKRCLHVAENDQLSFFQKIVTEGHSTGWLRNWKPTQQPWGCLTLSLCSVLNKCCHFALTNELSYVILSRRLRSTTLLFGFNRLILIVYIGPILCWENCVVNH